MVENKGLDPADASGSPPEPGSEDLVEAGPNF